MMYQVALWVLVAPALLASSYLLLLSVFAWQQAPKPKPADRFRFDIIVPAHNEEAGIGRTVRSLLEVDWPKEDYRVVVVADNCSDHTAERAVEAGAEVLVRSNPVLRGKGYALEQAFRNSQDNTDAVVVVDADSVVSSNLLLAFAARLSAGEHAIQARYGVLNQEASWRTRLMALAFALFHDVRSLGRERIGVSCGLRGNGMCFTRQVLARVPYAAFSIVEDLEYGIQLGEAGIRVSYAHEAVVLGDMVSSERASRSQRRRWEGGRFSQMRQRGPNLLVKALRQRSFLLLDLALDLLLPPLSWISCYTALVASLAAYYSVQHGTVLTSFWFSLMAVAFIGVYFLRGWQASGLGLAAVMWFPLIPVYVVWKLSLLLATSARAPKEFVRTTRETFPSDTKDPRG